MPLVQPCGPHAPPRPGLTPPTALNARPSLPTPAASAESTMWAEVRADVETILRLGAVALADEPLWSLGQAEWALHWGLDWGVWIDWYRNRLRGGSRGERYELVFAIVPLDAWEKGPQTANAWIEAHLAKE